MFFKIRQCYDSHVHLQGTAEFLSRSNLVQMQKASDLHKLTVLPEAFRGHWLMGQGWDDHDWPANEKPSLALIDQKFPDHPVFFLRADAHSAWLNSHAFKAIGVTPTLSGVIHDKALPQVYAQLPAYTREQTRELLLKAQTIFLKAGFTHVRDLTCSRLQWEVMRELESAGDWKLHVEANFLCDHFADFPKLLQTLQLCRSEKSTLLRVGGVKVFVDGALGSNGAWLSHNYCGCNHRGYSLWTASELQQILQQTWQHKFEFAAHAIGDAAAEMVADVALAVQLGGVSGILNIEHVEVASPETLKKLKQLAARLHFQPCHYLSDKVWLKEKLGSLYDYVFPWALAENLGLRIHFGSDSPVATASLSDNKQGVREAKAAGIPAPAQDWWHYHQHPDPHWGSDCFTEVDSATAAVHRVVYS